MSKNNAQRQHAHHTDIEKSISEKIHAFHTLQKLFVKLIFLCHFDSECHLYINVNAFKQYSFSTVIYHINSDSDDTEFLCQKIQSILFLNKLLTSAKQNYRFMKIKTAELI